MALLSFPGRFEAGAWAEAAVGAAT